MAEKPTLHEARLEQAMAYYGGDLSPDEASEFEAHLATCAGCQEALRMARATLPVAEQVLAFTPKRSIDEQVARFEAMAAEKRLTEKAPSLDVRRLQLWIGVALGAVTAAVIALALLRQAPTTPRRDQVFAPLNDSDDDDDGG